MQIALVQQHATRDRSSNLAGGLAALDHAAAAGARVVCFAEQRKLCGPWPSQ